jgi:hypothetical protein
MDNTKLFRQYLSNYIDGPNINAILYAFGEAYNILEQNGVAVTDQLTISTASERYLDRLLSDLAITRPPELGISDYYFRKIGINITASKQITSSLHSILEIFYGPDFVRGSTICTKSEPYDLSGNPDLSLIFEDGEVRTLVFYSANFSNVFQATAQEVANVINVWIKNQNLNAYATVETDFDTGLKYVKLYGGAKGPYSLIQVWGGRAQSILEFPTMRDTKLAPLNTTTWQITKNNETTIRVRWDGGPKPSLDKVLIDDRVLIYGTPFQNANSELIGSFTITNVSPPQSIPNADSGWFEFKAVLQDLKNSTPNAYPPPNSPGNIYSYTVNQTVYDDLKFFLARKNTPYSTKRYALAFEPAANLLKIYLPATTTILERDLIGASHLHMLYNYSDFDGTFGDLLDDNKKIEILNTYSIRYYQGRADNSATGGTVTLPGPTVLNISEIYRENGYVTIITETPHGLIGENEWQNGIDYTAGTIKVYNNFNWLALQNSGPSYGGSKQPDANSLFWQQQEPTKNYTTSTIIVNATGLIVDDPVNSFLGPYTFDSQSNYTLASGTGFIRSKINAGEIKTNILVTGGFSQPEGYLMFDLNENSQEGPVKYLYSQQQKSNIITNIVNISRITNKVTVTTNAPHNAVPGSQVVISGTTTFNGVWTVTNVPSSNVYDFVHTSSGSAIETSGVSTTLIEENTYLLTLESGYQFKETHNILSDLDIVSNPQAYVPNIDGSDYCAYLTGSADARIYCETLLRRIIAAGIKLEVIVIYPSDLGLGNEGDGTSQYQAAPISEAATYVWASSST